MARKVNLDAMIPREDFAVEMGTYPMTDLIKDFPISLLYPENPILRLLRKPDFQRETNHWSPTQLVTFLASFVDYEVIPGLILWKAPRFIFVIDGGHRISALRAWMEDDYGDGHVSQRFYNGTIPAEQRRIAIATRKLVERQVGRFSTLRDRVDVPGDMSDILTRRAQVAFTRPLALQWIPATDPEVAESSFFKINSQGTPLDEVETILIKNRRKPIAIAARAILRAGSGHKYWRRFDQNRSEALEAAASEFHTSLFVPEAESPVKTLDLPLGGSVSPVNALALLIEFLSIAGSPEKEVKAIGTYENDDIGEATIEVLQHALKILSRITGNKADSLGLHPVVYFYNERGSYNRFLFLGMTLLIHNKLKNNDDYFFKKFTIARRRLEHFLIENKSLIGIVLQNLGKASRVPKMRSLFEFLIKEFQTNETVKPEAAITEMGLRGRVVDVREIPTGPRISDSAKSFAYLKPAIEIAHKCPICKGLLDTKKSMSYDHKVAVRDGGTGDADNVQVTHHYCDSIKLWLEEQGIVL